MKLLLLLLPLLVNSSPIKNNVIHNKIKMEDVQNGNTTTSPSVGVVPVAISTQPVMVIESAVPIYKHTVI